MYVCMYLTYGCTLRGNKYEASISQVVKLQNKAVRIINNVPLRAHITSHYANLGLIKFPDIVKLKTCQLFYDLIVDNKLHLSYLSNAIMQLEAQPSKSQFLRTNIRKFCPKSIGYFIGIILLYSYVVCQISIYLKELSLQWLFYRYRTQLFEDRLAL